MANGYKRPHLNYRTIYRNHHGSIPKDEHGRSYEIHHIDGDYTNNSIDNLIALSIQEHYDVHLAQGDWYACLRIAQKMKKSPEEIREIARRYAQEQIDNKTHNFLGGAIQRARVMNGTHHWLGGEMQSKNNALRVKEGTHNLLGVNNPVHKRIANGTHHTLGPANNKKC